MASWLAGILGRLRSWKTQEKLLDHMPIFLELDFDPIKNKYPFKLNHSWLEKYSLRLLVKEIWKRKSVSNILSTMARLERNIMELKNAILFWERKRKKKNIKKSSQK